MHARTTSIVVFDRTELPGDRRRFAAALCFMLFFAKFVFGGTRFWLEISRQLGLRALGWFEFWLAVSQLTVGISGYLAGRALWRGHRSARWWLAAVIICLLIEIGVDIGFALSWLQRWPSSDLRELLFVFEQELIHDEFPCILAMSATLWLSLGRIPLLSKRYPSWLILAMAWAVGGLLTPNAFHLPYLTAPFSPAVGYWPWILSKALFFMALVLMLFRCRRLRMLSIIIAAVQTAIFIKYSVMFFPNLVGDSVITLLASARHCRGWPPSPFPLGVCYLNRTTLQYLVQLVLQAGPWILIAIYARKYPMRVPAEDGSPWPRAYCGNCGYNLSGIEPNICPECGRQLS